MGIIVIPVCNWDDKAVSCGKNYRWTVSKTTPGHLLNHYFGSWHRIWENDFIKSCENQVVKTMKWNVCHTTFNHRQLVWSILWHFSLSRLSKFISHICLFMPWHHPAGRPFKHNSSNMKVRNLFHSNGLPKTIYHSDYKHIGTRVCIK